MKCLCFACAVATLFSVACAPLVELEDETVALRTRVDSLDGQLSECRTETVRLRERLSAVEEQNLALDDRNRALSAALAEAQYQSPDAVSPDAVSPDANTRASGTADGEGAVSGMRTPVSDIPVDGGPAAAGATAPLHDGRVPADIAFLGRYQTALGAYNSRLYPDALRQFAELLSGARPNDMIDNCLYWMGESAMQLGRHYEAVRHFTRVVAFTGADKVDDALYSRAMAHKAAGQSAQARADLELLLRQFPHSEFTGQARGALKSLQ